MTTPNTEIKDFWNLIFILPLLGTSGLLQCCILKKVRKMLILAFEASRTSQNITFFQSSEEHCENTKTQYCHDMVKKEHKTKVAKAPT